MVMDSSKLIRLCSLRSAHGDYVIADYDPINRTLMVIEGMLGGEPYDTCSGIFVPWSEDKEPWEDKGDFPAFWERIVPNHLPNPRYGPLLAEGEMFIHSLVDTRGISDFSSF